MTDTALASSLTNNAKPPLIVSTFLRSFAFLVFLIVL